MSPEPKKGYGDHAIDALRCAILSLCAGTEMTVMRINDAKAAPWGSTGKTVPVYIGNAVAQSA